MKSINNSSTINVSRINNIYFYNINFLFNFQNTKFAVYSVYNNKYSFVSNYIKSLKKDILLLFNNNVRYVTKHRHLRDRVAMAILL